MPLINVSELFSQAVITATENLLQSVCTRGLLPLADIPDRAYSIPMTSTSTVEGNICVNFVDLRGTLSAPEIQTICQTLALEEYTGVSGIALERGWPLCNPADEIMQRLMNICVFILVPPIRAGVTQEQEGDGTIIETCCYRDDDGISVERDLCITGRKPEKTHRIAEIKTKRSFSLADMRAILVPEKFITLVTKIFNGITFPIIPVKSGNLEFRRMPYTTSALHGQKTEGGITCDAPNYQQAFLEYINGHPGENFAVHAVRLPTIYDFELRYVRNIVDSQELLTKTRATIVDTCPDGSGWCVVSKQFAFARADMIARLREAAASIVEDSAKEFYQGLAQQIEVTNRENEELLVQYKAAVGKFKMSRYKDRWQPGQVEALEKLGAHIVSLDQDQLKYAMISYPESCKEAVKSIVNSRPVYQYQQQIKEKAAITIQGFFRGYVARKAVTEVRTSTATCEAAKVAYEAAAAALKRSQGRLLKLTK